MYSCYILQRDQSGSYIYYKGTKTAILKDEQNNMYFFNKKGKKIKLVMAEPFEMGNPFKKRR